MSIAEERHVVNILPPVDINGGANTDIVSLKGATDIDIVLQLGVTGGTSVVTVEECDTVGPNDNTAIAFDYYTETTAAGDTLSDRTAVSSSGFTTSANDGVFYVISVRASALTAGYPYVRVCMATPGASVIASAVAIVNGIRYPQENTVTRIT